MGAGARAHSSSVPLEDNQTLKGEPLPAIAIHEAFNEPNFSFVMISPNNQNGLFLEDFKLMFNEHLGTLTQGTNCKLPSTPDVLL